MILYDENRNEGLLEFGIQIPVLASRAVKAFEFLKLHPLLGPKIDQWHIRKIEGPITKEDLLRVHSSEYVEKLYSAELEKEIIRTSITSLPAKTARFTSVLKSTKMRCPTLRMRPRPTVFNASGRANMGNSLTPRNSSLRLLCMLH